MVVQNRLRLAPVIALSLIAVFFVFGGADAAEPTVITLTQTGCQFVESEGVDHGFKTKSAADCKAINAKTSKDRLAKARRLS